MCGASAFVIRPHSVGVAIADYFTFLYITTS